MATSRFTQLRRQRVVRRVAPGNVADLLRVPDLLLKFWTWRQGAGLPFDVRDDRVFKAVEALQDALAGGAILDVLAEAFDHLRRDLAQRQIAEYLPTGASRCDRLWLGVRVVHRRPGNQSPWPST